MTKLFVDPGVEQWVPAGRRKLRELQRLRQQFGTSTMQRVWELEPGVTCWVQSADFGDTIRIIGGKGYGAYQPYHELWAIAPALLPATRPDSTLLPVLTWSQIIQHVSTTYESKDGSYTRRHWLVICRYCKRVAQYTWDEVKTVNPDDPELYTVTGVYAGHDGGEGTWVDVIDYAEDGTPTTRRLDISPSLKQQSDDNPWGWIEGEGDDPPHPGPPPQQQSIGGFTAQNLVDDANPGFPWFQHVYGTQTLHYDGFGNLLFGDPVTNWTTTEPFDGAADGWTQAEEDAYLGQVQWQGKSIPPDKAAALDAAIAQNAQETHDWLVATLNKARTMLDLIATMMWEKKIGNPDTTELTLPAGLLNDKMAAALVSDTTSAAKLGLSADIDGVLTTITYDFDSVFDPLILNNLMYGADLALLDPPVPPPPSNPWEITIDASKRCEYDPGTWTFSPAEAETKPIKFGYLSRSASPLVLGQTKAVVPYGMYETKNVSYEALTPTQLDDLNKALCVGDVSDIDLGRILIHSTVNTKTTAAARDYRKTEHTHTSGAYSFTQPVIQ